MPPSSRIPSLLQPHTHLPKDDSILLLTSTLGASANWLIIRFLCEALNPDRSTHQRADGGTLGEGNEDVAVILVSWMRDWDFWRSEARKGGGLDLERLRSEKKLAFVDGLSNLFLPKAADTVKSNSAVPTGGSSQPSQSVGLPASRTPNTILPGRGPPTRIPAPTPTAMPPTVAKPEVNARSSGHFVIETPEISAFQRSVENAIRHIQSTMPRKKALLVLDTPSLLLASYPNITPSILSTTVLQLHNLASHVLVHVPADDALLTLSTSPQPLELDAHNFLVKTAHMSTRILSCRVLDTGVAKDVSGVLRVTENTAGPMLDLEQGAEVNAESKHGRELLYLVKGDGSVKMFERGAGGDM